MRYKPSFDRKRRSDASPAEGSTRAGSGRYSLPEQEEQVGLPLRAFPAHTMDLVLTYAWSRLDLDQGLGLVRLDRGDPTRVEGHEVAVDGGKAWAVTFRVELDQEWRTRVAQIAVINEAGERTLLLEADGEGNWLQDGAPSPELQGCLDVDIAATPFTNTLVISRLGLPVGETAEIRAAWVGVPNLEVETVEQTYLRLQPRHGLDRYEYRAGGAAKGRIIEVDQDGVAMHYEGFARRTHP